MQVPLLTINGTEEGKVELSTIFLTDFRKDLIHKAFTNLYWGFYHCTWFCTWNL